MFMGIYKREASILHLKTNWNEYMLHHGVEFPELGKKKNCTICTDMRWATHLDECKQLDKFKHPILTYQCLNIYVAIVLHNMK